ncbi:MAG: Tfp pilus assembly protein FimT/FimU [Candidatus Methylacidiphilales bacterium]|nr:prepilin-type N-terminal cleavage/methylation domain-containing protein [Candidatus Methylacidiphilales bacterium]
MEQLSPLVRNNGRRNGNKKAFTLIELMSVLAVVAILSATAGPALSALVGAGDINRSITTLSGTLELARTYSMTHHTYVRVAFSTIPVGGSRLTPGVGVMVMYSADGTLDADTPADMTDITKWPEANKALFLENLSMDDSLNSSTPATSQDVIPSASDIGSFNRRIGGIASASFTSFVQFGPDGEARVLKGEPARYIKLGMNRPAQQKGRNPFVLRVSGINGTIHVLRKESL